MSLTPNNIASYSANGVAFFRFKKLLPGTYLITNDVGVFAYLTSQEFSEFIAGKLPEGPKKQELVEKKFLYSDVQKYTNESALAFAKKNTFLAAGPSLHIVVTTLRCNHKCQYCHAAVAPMTAKEMDMTLETAKKTLETIFHTSSNNLTIEFQGGESLVNWEVVKYLVTEARIRATHLQKKLSLALVSNLTLMDDEKMDFLLSNGVQISTSLDGDEETHNYNRTFKEGNSFAQVTSWIKKLNEEYAKRGIVDVTGSPLKVGALLTVTKKTLTRYKEVIDAYVSLGLDGIFLRSLNPYGFAAADLANLGYTSEEFIEFYRKSMDYILEINKKGVNFREQISGLYLTKILTPDDPNYLDERSPCGACIGQVAYNYDGKIYSCDEGRMLGRMGISDFQMGQLEATGAETYKKMLQSETTKVMVQASTVDGLPGYNENVYKPYIGVCPIHSYKTTGNIYPVYAVDDKRRIGAAILDYLFVAMMDPENMTIFRRWVGYHDGVVSQCKM